MLKGLVLVLLNQYNPFVHQWLKKITSPFLFTHGQELCTEFHQLLVYLESILSRDGARSRPMC